jgi:hypothetical protein
MADVERGPAARNQSRKIESGPPKLAHDKRLVLLSKQGARTKPRDARARTVCHVASKIEARVDWRRL